MSLPNGKKEINQSAADKAIEIVNQRKQKEEKLSKAKTQDSQKEVTQVSSQKVTKEEEPRADTRLGSLVPDEHLFEHDLFVGL